ncbi:MAG: ABC transporter permease [Verrucomicrobia bacterium]|nr:ABC transporter permease [Verrucomicrobiota bacterium]MDA1087731.1 ABC transporter permease [Verrucomicrobiota bacterium]
MNLIGFRSLLFRECHRFLRLWNQTLIPPLVTAALYLLIFGYSLGSRIRSIDGLSYLEFLIPGLVMMSVIGGSYANTSTSMYISRFQGHIAELLVSSMSNLEIVLATVLGGVVRGLSVGICVAAVTMPFANIVILHFWTTLFFIVAVAFVFSCAGFLSGIWADDFERLSVFQTYILTPLTYLGGVFFSVDMLPPLWRGVALANPILYFINGLRYGFLGASDVGIVSATALVCVVGVVLFGASYAVFRSGYHVKT